MLNIEITVIIKVSNKYSSPVMYSNYDYFKSYLPLTNITIPSPARETPNIT